MVVDSFIDFRGQHLLSQFSLQTHYLNQKSDTHFFSTIFANDTHSFYLTKKNRIFYVNHHILEPFFLLKPITPISAYQSQLNTIDIVKGHKIYKTYYQIDTLLTHQLWLQGRIVDSSQNIVSRFFSMVQPRRSDKSNAGCQQLYYFQCRRRYRTLWNFKTQLSITIIIYMNTESLKEKVAHEAVEQVSSNILIGLGTGSTTNFFIKALGKKIANSQLNDILATTTSHSSTLLARQCNIPLIDISAVEKVDLYVDGADEVDPKKNLIKGRGAAMVREKIIAENSKRFIIIVDETKLVDSLGTRFSIPVEILPCALGICLLQLQSLNGSTCIRMAKAKDGPVVTDQGNFIIDTHFSPETNWQMLNTQINNISGVVGHGLFLNKPYYECWVAKGNQSIDKF